MRPPSCLVWAHWALRWLTPLLRARLSAHQLGCYWVLELRAAAAAGLAAAVDLVAAAIDLGAAADLAVADLAVAVADLAVVLTAGVTASDLPAAGYHFLHLQVLAL